MKLNLSQMRPGRGIVVAGSLLSVDPTTGCTKPLKSSLIVGHGAVSCASLLFQVAYLGLYGKEGMISLRNWAIYKINIKSNIYYTQMIVEECSGGCLFAEHQPPARLNCPVLRRNNTVHQRLGCKVKPLVCGQVMTCVFSCFLVRAGVIGISYSKHR